MNYWHYLAIASQILAILFGLAAAHRQSADSKKESREYSESKFNEMASLINKTKNAITDGERSDLIAQLDEEQKQWAKELMGNLPALIEKDKEDRAKGAQEQLAQSKTVKFQLQDAQSRTFKIVEAVATNKDGVRTIVFEKQELSDNLFLNTSNVFVIDFIDKEMWFCNISTRTRDGFSITFWRISKPDIYKIASADKTRFSSTVGTDYWLTCGFDGKYTGTIATGDQDARLAEHVKKTGKLTPGCELSQAIDVVVKSIIERFFIENTRK